MTRAKVCDGLLALFMLAVFVLLAAAPPIGWALVAGVFILVVAGSL